MPTIWYEEGYRFWFYASDGQETPHVHVERGQGSGKWWLTGEEQWSRGFLPRERRAVRRIVTTRRSEFLAAWRAFFGGDSR